MSAPNVFRLFVGSTNVVKQRAAAAATVCACDPSYEGDGAAPETPLVRVLVRPVAAAPGIADWLAPRSASGQPFGCRQTGFGALNRLDKCMELARAAAAQEPEEPDELRPVCASSENGLVCACECACSGDDGSDGAYTDAAPCLRNRDVVYCAVAARERRIVQRGRLWASTECRVPCAAPREECERQAALYQETIGPRLRAGEDLYARWPVFCSTPAPDAPSAAGPWTRERCTRDAFGACFAELAALAAAEDVLRRCARDGPCASAGNRYRFMLWTRDLAYMTPQLLRLDLDPCVLDGYVALEDAQAACSSARHVHAFLHDGYRQVRPFGSVPIVHVREPHRAGFLHARVVGAPHDPYWYLKMGMYVNAREPGLAGALPPLSAAVLDFQTLTQEQHDQLSAPERRAVEQDLRALYARLGDLRRTLLARATAPARRNLVPAPSFALRAFMQEQQPLLVSGFSESSSPPAPAPAPPLPGLHFLTPGTRDSEIHFLRGWHGALLPHLRACAPAGSEDTASLCAWARRATFRCLLYMRRNEVLDAEDGLPRGADSRDMLADLLYDSKCLTNAVFWLDALQAVRESARWLDFGTFPREECAELRRTADAAADGELDLALRALEQWSVDAEIARLRQSIARRFFAADARLLDFVPGPRCCEAALAPGGAVQPLPEVTRRILREHNLAFLGGAQTDAQGVAYAVLSDALELEPARYARALEQLRARDSEIGIVCFSPISGKSAREEDLLYRARGDVVWPHVAWTAVRALLKIAAAPAHLVDKRVRGGALDLAERQRQKLLRLPHNACAEWYAYDAQLQCAVAGGELQQGWSAAALLAASQAFVDFYAQYSTGNLVE